MFGQRLVRLGARRSSPPEQFIAGSNSSDRLEWTIRVSVEQQLSLIALARPAAWSVA